MYRILLFLSMLLPRVINAQSSEAFLRKAMTANGPWEKIRAIDYATHRTSYNQWQGYRFDKVQLEEDTYQVYVDLVKNRHWHHTLGHYPGGYIFNTVRISRDSTYYVYDLDRWRTGKALLQVPGDLWRVNHRNILNSFPWFILKEVLESGDSLQIQAGRDTILIRRVMGAGIQELRFEPRTLLLTGNRVITGNAVREQHFGNYIQTGEGYRLPKKMILKQNGEPVLTDQVTSFLPLATADSARFRLPVDYTLQLDTAPQLRARELAKDIYLVERADGDRNILFISMDDQVLLTEAPVSGRLTREIIRLIHQTLPGKKIGYVHLSHFHNDHIAGIRELVKEGATVICTASMEEPVREMISATSNSRTPADTLHPVFGFFSGYKVLEDPHHRIEFYEVPNTHALGMSFLYLPSEKLIYEGDLLSMPEDASITPAFRVSEEFYQFLNKNGISYRLIIGHHGLAMITPELFQQMIEAGKKTDGKWP